MHQLIRPISSAKILGLLLVSGLFFLCANSLAENQMTNDSSGHHHATADHQSHNHSSDSTKIFSCPMHPDETSHEAGRCSICGMFLVEQNETTEMLDEHQHHHDMAGMNQAEETEDSATIYACPMHPGETSHEPGRCSICGMFLVAQQADEKPMASKQMMDHSTHDHHEAPATHSHHTPNDMPMQSGHKSKRYWEERDSATPMMGDHNHAGDKQPSLLETAKPASDEQLPAIAVTTDEDMHNHDHDHNHEHASKTHVCPMHPQIVSEDPDATCPICGMDLVEKSLSPVPNVSSGSQQETYICPMHPQIVSHDPDATCPICGMDLVLKAAADDSMQSGEPQVFLDSAVIQNMGIRTVTAKRGDLGKSVNTQGIVTPDDERTHNIHPRTGGWVERVYPIAEGDRIERKEELIDFHSPWINQAQLDFITAMEEYDLASYEPTRRAELDAKIDAYRNTLRSLNVPPMDLMRIEKSRKVLNTIQMTAPAGGWITDLNVTDGAFVEPYDTMFTIVDLSQVWVMVDIFEHQAPWVRRGQQVTISTTAIPGRKWSGRIEFIYPQVNPKTRTLRARIEVPNPDEALLLNMFVQVDLSEGAAKKDVVQVPRESIILTGEREVVVKFLGKGHFQPVEVETGLWGDEHVEIVTGVDAGDEIVVSGQFLIDSESNIQSSLLRMME